MSLLVVVNMLPHVFTFCKYIGAVYRYVYQTGVGGGGGCGGRGRFVKRQHLLHDFS